MGRETYTFKINQEKLRANLIPRLKNGAHEAKSFSDYINNEVNPRRERTNWSSQTNYYPLPDPLQIIETLEGSQTNFSATALGLAFNWLSDVDNLNDVSEEISNTTLAHSGFEIVYTLWTKDKCWVYLNQLGEFEYRNGLEVESDCYDGTYHLYANAVFKRYLHYLLMLLKKLNLDTQYKGHSIYYSANELSFLNDEQVEEVLDQQTNEVLTWIRNENEKADIAEKNEINYRRPYDITHYYVASEMFFQIKELQEILQDFDGKIFIHDSL